MDGGGGYIFIGFSMLLLGLYLGLSLGTRLEAWCWRDNIIKRGFAIYDAKTGKWRWKEPGE